MPEAAHEVGRPGARFGLGGCGGLPGRAARRRRELGGVVGLPKGANPQFDRAAHTRETVRKLVLALAQERENGPLVGERAAEAQGQDRARANELLDNALVLSQRCLTRLDALLELAHDGNEWAIA